MIFKHNGQAPRRFPHLIHGMSHFEMSGHDTKVGSFDLILLPNQIFCAHCIKKHIRRFPQTSLTTFLPPTESCEMSAHDLISCPDIRKRAQSRGIETMDLTLNCCNTL